MNTVFALVAVCQFFGRIRVEDNLRHSYFYIEPEYRLDGHEITGTAPDSELSCSRKYPALEVCKSGNFRISESKHRNCELSSRKCSALEGCKSGNFRRSESEHKNCELCSRRCPALEVCQSGNFGTSESKHENCELSSRKCSALKGCKSDIEGRPEKTANWVPEAPCPRCVTLRWSMMKNLYSFPLKM